MRVARSLLLFAGIAFLTAESLPSQADERAPVPGAEDQAKSEGLIKDLFKAELAKTKLADRAALAGTLMQQAEEAKNPQRDMPIGIIGSLLICTVLYIGVVVVLTGMVRYDQLDEKAAVAQAFDVAGVASETLAEAVVLAGAEGRLIERGAALPAEYETQIAAKTYANVGPVTVAVARIGAPA